jgi:hypothetical protein
MIGVTGGRQFKVEGLTLKETAQEGFTAEDAESTEIASRNRREETALGLKSKGGSNPRPTLKNQGWGTGQARFSI